MSVPDVLSVDQLRRKLVVVENHQRPATVEPPSGAAVSNQRLDIEIKPKTASSGMDRILNRIDSLLEDTPKDPPRSRTVGLQAPLSPKAKRIIDFLDSSVDTIGSVDSSLATLQHTARFFDECSSSSKGRYRVNNARYARLPNLLQLSRDNFFKSLLLCRDFDAKTLHIQPNPYDAGISFLMGKKAGEQNREQVVTILFDRNKFSEEQALKWWTRNKGQSEFQ